VNQDFFFKICINNVKVFILQKKQMIIC